MNASTSSAESLASAPAPTFVDGIDERVIRIADRLPSTRVLLMVLGVSLLTLLFLALTGGRQGSSRSFAGAPTEPPAAVSADRGPASAVAAPVTPGRQEPAVAPTAVQPVARSDTTLNVAPAASAVVAPVVPAQRIEILRTDLPPRVVDMVRSEPLSPHAAEIVRAEPVPPRVADTPRVDTPVGATRQTPIESTLSSATPRNREVTPEPIPMREESPRPAIDARPAAERAPSPDPAGGSAL